jgi:hypothetical protein
MVLLDSRLPKYSNGISFANFGPRDQKIWILQDSMEFWFENLNRICFKSEAGTWQLSIGSYRFGWIDVLSRWILRRLDGSDLAIPFQLVICFKPMDLDLTVAEKRRESSPG